MKMKVTVTIIIALLFCVNSIQAVSLVRSGSQKDFNRITGKTTSQKNGAAMANGHNLFKPLTNTGAGSLDSTFGTNGTLLVPGAPNATGQAVAIQSDGKIVIAGYSGIEGNNNSESDFLAARFNSNGTIDSAFGIDGWSRVSITGEAKLDFANSVAIQPDGKIVLAGYLRDSSGNWAFAVARLNSNGDIDSSFGNNGSLGFFITGGDGSDLANSVAIQSDGKIVIAGDSYGQFYVSALGSYETNQAFAVVRLNSDGSFDNTFGIGGKERYQFLNDSTESSCNAVVIQSDGKIVVAGTTSQNNTYFNVTRLNPDGSLDNTFGTNGTNLFLLNDGDMTSQKDCTSAAIQIDGKIVLGGNTVNPYSSIAYFALARVNPNGSIDSSFGLNGSEIVRKESPTFSRSDFFGTSIAVQSDGKIIEGGYEDVLNDFTLACFNPDGTIDSTFGSNGWAFAHIGSILDAGDMTGMAIDQDGNIVAAGSSADENLYSSFAAARFLSDGITAVSPVNQLPKSFFLSQNYPNPFNPTTIINYQIPKEGFVTLIVYDILGNVVKTLVDGHKTQGKYSVNFNAGNLASGVYFYQLHAGSFAATKKLLLLK